jgi:asparagine synthase (glutamine-hydrolysing)
VTLTDGDRTRVGGSWFAVLPDTADATAGAGPLAQRASRILRHASGRPWLIGRWMEGATARSDSCQLVTGPRLRVAVFGATAEAQSVVTAAVARHADQSAIAEAVSSLPGSMLTVSLSRDGVIRMQAPLSGVRRLFSVEIAGASVLSDRADVLAELIGPAIDDSQLAGRLLSPYVPYPISWDSLWSGVRSISSDDAVTLDAAGRLTATPRKRGGSPLVRDEAVRRVRAALRDGVATRVRSGSPELGLTADLSGGMDSTSLCFLAHAAGARFTTVTQRDPDPGNDDESWADEASLSLPGMPRLLLGRAETGLQFADPASAGIGHDEPFIELRSHGVFVRLAELLAEHGSTAHVFGFGGDEAFRSPSIYLHGLLRRRPQLLASHVRGLRARFRWPWPEVVRGLIDDRPFERWLADERRQLLSAQAPPTFPTGWGPSLRLPPWVTPAGVDAVRSLITDQAATARPLGRTREEHAAWERVRMVATAVRQIDEILQPHGIVAMTPFLDDSVLRVTLAVRPEDRSSPWRYKPLLVDAMAGLVPAPLLGRMTKGDASTEVYAGLRANLPRLLDLCDSSLLAQRGLIDADTLRSALLRPLSPDVELNAVTNTLTVEAWLRGASTARTTKHTLGNNEEETPRSGVIR